MQKGPARKILTNKTNVEVGCHKLVVSVTDCHSVVCNSDQLYGNGGIKCPQSTVCSWSPAQKIHGMSRKFN